MNLLAPQGAQGAQGDGHGPASAQQIPSAAQPAAARGSRKLILCFDGTGNKFHGDESDSNILKIFRMLDREADDQYHYYQPGIGTYVTSPTLSHTSLPARFSSWYLKAKDSAIGSSFDQHVVGGYRFLMRFYNPGDEIYMFGFSRGSYIARFLAEMIDHIGLLSHGNEEMVKFAWKAFAQWQSRQGVEEPEDEDEEREKWEKEHKGEWEGWDEGKRKRNKKAWERFEVEKKKEREMYHFMKNFRETFSRPVGRIRFLGLFDTVNSVPRFETAWMGRGSKFPYTAKSSARVIRHAVSIDERRAKFRQDLMYQGKQRRRRPKHRGVRHMIERVSAEIARPLSSHHEPKVEEDDEKSEKGEKEKEDEKDGGREYKPKRQQEGSGEKPVTIEERGRSSSGFLKPNKGARRRKSHENHEECRPYRARSRSRSCGTRNKDATSILSGVSGVSATENEGETSTVQDIDEVWFSGGHGDVGGGWEAPVDGRKSTSHIPLVWMIREAIRAGLPFDPDKVAELGCGVLSELRKLASPEAEDVAIPTIQVEDSTAATMVDEEEQEKNAAGCGHDHEKFNNMLTSACTAPMHDSLTYGSALGFFGTTAWKIMEYMPFRRMDLREDGTWKPIRWPLPRGEVRDVPDNVRVHGSVLQRMRDDEGYRPGNLIVGGGGRGVRKAPKEHGMGEWVCVEGKGDLAGEIWVRKSAPGSK